MMGGAQMNLLRLFHTCKDKAQCVEQKIKVFTFCYFVFQEMHGDNANMDF